MEWYNIFTSPFLHIEHLGWLDDIGLPQYKDVFSDARVDARMLHYMTVVSEDNVSHHKNIQSTKYS